MVTIRVGATLTVAIDQTTIRSTVVEIEPTSARESNHISTITE